MNKYKNRIIALSLITTSALVGCSNSMISMVKFDETEASKVVENLDKMIFEAKEDVDRYDIYKYVNENLDKMPDLEMSSSMVNSFIYLIYNNVEYYYNLVMVLQEEIKSLESTLNLDKVDETSLSKITEDYKIVKALLEELNLNYLKLVKNFDTYEVEVDIDRISEEFKELINNDTKN